jgi:lysozyme
MAKTIDGKRVSGRWHRLLTAAERDGVQFLLTSGRRTMAEQTRLFHQNMQFVGGRWVRRPGRPLTAFPNPNAPHIRVGRAAHAIDVNALDGGETRLQRWLEGKGLHPTNPVIGEAWHLEVPEAELRRAAARQRREDRKAAAKKRQEERDRKAGRRAADSRKLTQRGLDLIAEFEGFVPHAYNDPAGHATAGFGRLLHHGPVNDQDRQRYGTKENPKLTRAVALRMLEEDAEKFEKVVQDVVKVPITQGEFNALVSFSFNVGAGALRSSTLLRLLNDRRRGSAAREFRKWDKAGGKSLPGLTRRRKAEARMFRGI